MKFIRLYGSVRSGTNYLYLLITRNFKDVFVSESNKHGRPTEWSLEQKGKMLKSAQEKYAEHQETHDIPLDYAVSREPIGDVLIYKNPYAVVQGEMNIGVPLSDAVQRWNRVNRWLKDWEKIYRWRVMLVKYEDLLTEGGRNRVLYQMEIKFELDCSGDQFVDIAEHSHSKKTIHRANEAGHYDKEWQLNRGFLDELTEEEISMINKELDRKLMKAFGYNIIGE